MTKIAKSVKDFKVSKTAVTATAVANGSLISPSSDRPPFSHVPPRGGSGSSMTNGRRHSSVLSLDNFSARGSSVSSQLDDVGVALTQKRDDDLEDFGDGDGADEGDGVTKPRAAWGSKLQYLLTIIGYAVGLGNIWRFPYLCQQNGGGAFLIPYVIMLFAEGIPMFYLELGIGQRIRKGSIGVWNEISPLLGGLGIASTMVCFIIGIYYNVIIAWCLYYISMSLRRVLPWSTCPTVLTYVPNVYLNPGPSTSKSTSKSLMNSALKSSLNSPRSAVKAVANLGAAYLVSPLQHQKDNGLVNSMLGNSLTSMIKTSVSQLSSSLPSLGKVVNTTAMVVGYTLPASQSADFTSFSNMTNHQRFKRESEDNFNSNSYGIHPKQLTRFVDQEDASHYANLPIVYESINPNKTIGQLISKNVQVTRIQKPNLECQLSSSTQYFWYRNTLNISSGIDVVDSFNWKIAICLLISWIVVFLCIMKGIKSSGKAAYFTATFPYAVLIIIFGRAISLKGAGLGLKHLFYPRTDKLADPQVWLDAATQIFYSFGLSFGSIIALSSYNPPRNNCRKDAILVSIINVFTPLFASLVIFSVLGFKATTNYETCLELNQETIFEYYKGAINMTYIQANYDDYVTKLNNTDSNLIFNRCNLQDNLNQAAEGTGLAFIVFTQAILEFPLSPLWSIIFFSMLITLGLGTMFGMMESILTSIHDLHLFPWLRKEMLAAVICSISFGCGLLFCLSSGEYWLKVFDAFAGTLSLVIIAFFEIIAVIYVYGHARFCHDLEIMTGTRPGWYWQITWRFVSPFVMFVILLASIIKWIIHKPTYNRYDIHKAQLTQTPYPNWVLGAVALLILLGSFPIPLVAFLRYFRILKFEPDIVTNVKRLRNTESTAKFISSTSTLNKFEESELGGAAVSGPAGSKPNLETIMEVP